MTIRGAKEHKARLDRLAARIGPALGEALLATATAIKSDAQVSITDGAKSGRIYEHEFRTINGRAVPIKKRAVAHQASAPGEAPADDTGGLATNIDAVLLEPLKAQVSSNAQYARHLEYGTSKMLARPYMGPAVDKNRETLRKNVTDVINREIRKGGK